MPAYPTNRTTPRISVHPARYALFTSLVATVAQTALAQPMPLVAESARPPVRFEYEIVNTFPHDTGAFTQGLIHRDGFLYESTGLNGRSSLRKVELETGKVVQQHDLDARYFAEGLTDWGNNLIQLTWQSQLGFVYDLKTFRQRSTFAYVGEGWGITRDAKRLIMSDGSAELRFLDPKTLAETGRVSVTYAGQPVRGLNELEYVNGLVFANVWGNNHIVMIDPDSGRVTGSVDLTGLIAKLDRAQGIDVLNGIAWDAKNERLFVTGKFWPKLFEIRLKPAVPN